MSAKSNASNASNTSNASNASSMVDLPIPKISQSLNVQKEDFVDYDRTEGEYKKSKTKKTVFLFFSVSDPSRVYFSTKSTHKQTSIKAFNVFFLLAS